MICANSSTSFPSNDPSSNPKEQYENIKQHSAEANP